MAISSNPAPATPPAINRAGGKIDGGVASAASAEKWAKVFSAISQGTRLQLVMALVARDGTTPTMLARDLNLAANNVSFHLRALELAGLVRMVRQGREKFYAVEFHVVEQAIRFLMKEFFGATDIRFRVARRLHQDKPNP